MVLVGGDDEMGVSAKRYQKLLKQRGIATQITLCDVQSDDLGEIYASLRKIILGAKDCVIDLTGGDECVIMAVGAVLAELPLADRKKIRVQKYDHEAHVLRDCFNDNKKIPTKPVHLTVQEFIYLHGGSILPDAYQPPKNSSYRDIDDLWEMSSDSPKDWNQTIKWLTEFESRSDSKTQVFLSRDAIKSVSDHEDKEEAIRDLLDDLDKKGIIKDQSNRHCLEYTYTSGLNRYCTQKAGNVLELKTLLEGRAVLEEGAPYFQDSQMSVSINWEEGVRKPIEDVEIRNEIDVILIRDTTPLFISCKNGNVEEHELYKLHTVAQRFGGPYAKKMLIVTDLGPKTSPANRSLRQRAWDMDILLVEYAAKLSKDEWRQIFKKAMQ